MSSGPSPREKGQRREPRAIATSALIHIVLIVATVATLYPILLVLKKALSPGQQFDLSLAPWPKHPTFAHFSQVIWTTDPATGNWLFGRQLANSLIVSLATTAVGVSLSLTAAYALSRYRFVGRNASLRALLVVQMFPSILLLIPIYLLLDRLGLVGSHTGLVLVYATTAIPFCVHSLRAYFDTLPKELDEAARLDGASEFAIFWRIVLPLSRPAIAITALFSFMTAWNEFILAAALLNREDQFTLPVLLHHYVGKFDTAWGLFAAGSVLVSLPVVILFYFLQRSLVAGLSQGAVKG